MGKRPDRSFNLSYDDIITRAQSVQPQFSADLPQFTAFDPAFTSETDLQLVALTRKGINDFSESGHRAEVESHTEQINHKLKAAGKLYQKLMYYADSGLGNTSVMSQTFGRSRYTKARKARKEMISLLNQATSAATQQACMDKLLAAGMPPTLISEMNSLSLDLAVADGDQEMLKKQRLLVTTARVDLFNSIWAIVSKISKAAKIIFAEDRARLTIYRLYDAKSPGADGASTSLKQDQ